MATGDYYFRMEELMNNASTTQEDIKDAYRVWSKTYDQVL